MIDYDPVQSLREEVERFKSSNKFSPLMVTHFYAQAACVLSYVKELEDALSSLSDRAQYVCAHRYGAQDPVGTRIVAVSDLKSEIVRANRTLKRK